MSVGVGLVMLQLKSDQVLAAQCHKSLFFTYGCRGGPLWIVLIQRAQVGGKATTSNLANDVSEGKVRPCTGS